MRIQFLRQFDEARVGDLLVHELQSDWTSFQAAVAFAKLSGIQHLKAPLEVFAADTSNRCISVVVGIDHHGTSLEALSYLSSVLVPPHSLHVIHNAHHARPTFHPKVYLFASEAQAYAIIGSNNLTSGGLFTNYESSLALHLDLSQNDDRKVYEDLRASFLKWTDTTSGIVLPVDADLLDRLVCEGLILPESQMSIPPSIPSSAPAPSVPSAFGTVTVPPPPSIPSTARILGAGAGTTVGQPPSFPTTFVMTLHKTDVGVGQVSPGTSARSPEIFIPLAARNQVPQFWGWPILFTQDPTHPGKWDRQSVSMNFRASSGSMAISVNMMTWPVKHDFRIRSGILRSYARVGDILKMRLLPNSTAHAYEISIISPQDPMFATYTQYCSTPVRNSRKRFGYY